MSNEPQDDPSIANTENLIRCINPEYHVKGEKISTQAFRPSSGVNGGMSVYIESSIIQAGHDPKTYVKSAKYPGSVTFSAGAARKLKLMVGRTPNANNPHHGDVWGELNLRDQRKRLRAACEWYVPISNVQIK